MSNIFDWDDEEEEKAAREELGGAYPLVQPPQLPAPRPSNQAAEPLELADVPAVPEQSSLQWNEVETVFQPRPEPSHEYPPYPPVSQGPRAEVHGFRDIHTTQPSGWGDYPPSFDDRPAQPGVWSEYPPDSPEETARKGGLAWSAGIVFFSSVAFMLFLGWIFDWLFGSSPWGLIAGIVVGSIVGFIQFFRISGRIFKPQDPAAAEHPLMPPDEPPH